MLFLLSIALLMISFFNFTLAGFLRPLNISASSSEKRRLKEFSDLLDTARTKSLDISGIFFLPTSGNGILKVLLPIECFLRMKNGLIFFMTMPR